MSSLFAAVEMAPRDPILGLNEAFNADAPDQGQPRRRRVLRRQRQDSPARRRQAPPRRPAWKPCRRAATSPSRARPPTTTRCRTCCSAPIHADRDGRVVTVEGLGGTGALKVGADYLKRLLPDGQGLISDPSWENHRALFESAGFTVDNYPYYDAATEGREFRRHEGQPRRAAGRHHRRPARLLPQPDRRRPLGSAMEGSRRDLRRRTSSPSSTWPIRASPTASKPDALALKLFAASGLQFFVSSSFSKSFSLYGERVGALSIVTAGKEESARVLSQVKRVIRTNYSNPPPMAAPSSRRCCPAPSCASMWEDELAGMRERIRAMRSGLVDKLRPAACAQDFSFVIKQRGMFSYTGLTAAQVERLKAEFGIYAVSTGRICLAALNTRNIDYTADAIAAVIK
jgi:aromatic-amino-acid transaminase